MELAVCGAIVQVWGSQKWARVGVGRTACPECARLTAVGRAADRRPLTLSAAGLRPLIAESPVISRPTMSACTESVPSKVKIASMSA